MRLRFIGLLGGALAVGTGTAAFAESADHYRGGWVSAEGPEIYQFVIRGNEVSGFHCTHCADGTTLSPLEGTFNEESGITFTIRKLGSGGETISERPLMAHLRDGQLLIDGGFARVTAIKDPRGPTPSPYPVAVLPPDAPKVPVLPAPGGGGFTPAPYVQPAPWRQLSFDDVEGVWLGFGVGMDKQYFIIRRDGERLFGFACGRCDNPYTFGMLENFKIDGDTLEFDIQHEDWGEGTVLPFTRHVTAHIAMNEMRIDARRADIPGGAPIVSSLVGPISIAATAGNVVGN